jgi:hypothetical protein
MKNPLKQLSLVLTPLFVSAVCLALGFTKPEAVADTATVPVDSTAIRDSLDFTLNASVIYDSLRLDDVGLHRQAFDNALKGWDKLKSEGKLHNESILAIADFSQSSNNKRLYVLDMENYKVLFNTLVAHGRNSGREWATRFSNSISSYQSSPGFYITGSTYNGSNGYSLKLDGMEKGINDKAMKRAIVMHGAPYVSESLISRLGYIGRSQGCPAVPARDAKKIINTLKNGACLYIHVPDQRYLSRSPILNDSSMS